MSHEASCCPTLEGGAQRTRQSAGPRLAQHAPPQLVKFLLDGLGSGRGFCCCIARRSFGVLRTSGLAEGESALGVRGEHAVQTAGYTVAFLVDSPQMRRRRPDVVLLNLHCWGASGLGFSLPKDCVHRRSPVITDLCASGSCCQRRVRARTAVCRLLWCSSIIALCVRRTERESAVLCIEGRPRTIRCGLRTFSRIHSCDRNRSSGAPMPSTFGRISVSVVPTQCAEGGCGAFIWPNLQESASDGDGDVAVGTAQCSKASTK